MSFKILFISFTTAVIKVKVHSRGAKCTSSMETQILLHRGIEGLRNRSEPLSDHTNNLLNQMKDEGIEILSSQLHRQTVVVWIWCHSQAAIEYIQTQYESNQLRDLLFGAANIQPLVDGIRTSEIIESKLIKIDSNEFKKTVGKCY